MILPFTMSAPIHVRDINLVKAWSLSPSYKVANGYRVCKIEPCDPRIRFSNIRFITPPVLGASTTFRWRMTPELRTFFSYMQGEFIQTHVASFYKECFEKKLTLDIVEDSLSFIRTSQECQYIHLKFSDSYDSLSSLDIDSTYSIDIELRGICIKANKINFDWKLIQIGMEEPMIQPSKEEDDDDSDDVPYPSHQELDAAKDVMVDTIQKHITQLELCIMSAQSDLDVLRELMCDLEDTNRPLEAICKVYDSIEKINLTRV